MENKKNRNKKLAIIAAMLALIVLILCLGGTTFAKYISSNTYEAKGVTVAKWGYVVNVDGANMFSKQYSHGSIITDDDAKVDEKKATIDIQATTLTVAPGASGSMTFGIEGKAEVLAKLVVAAEGTDVALAYKVKDADDSTAITYNPIKWKLYSDVSETSKTEITTAKGTLAEVIEELKKISADLPIAGTAVSKSYQIEWAWEFEATDEADRPLNNALDTALGAYSETKDGSEPVTAFTVGTTNYEVVTTATVVNFDFKLTVSVEQVQYTAPVEP